MAEYLSFIMEKRKYNTSIEKMQVFALENNELDTIKGGNWFEDFYEWVSQLFGGMFFGDSSDGNSGHSGGPK